MRAAVSATQPWIKADARLYNTNKKFVIHINIKDNSISNSFLILEDLTTKQFCFIPITADISTLFDGDIVQFLFSPYQGAEVTFYIPDRIDRELIISHLGKCSIFFVDRKDQFKKENTMFLNQISNSEVKNAVLMQAEGRSSLLTPIVLSKTAKEIWKIGAMEKNRNFYTKLMPLRISLLTWNVAGKHPKDDASKEFSNVFKDPVSTSDLVIIALEEIEMSVKSVVTGSSNYRKGWAEIIKLTPTLYNNPDYELTCAECIGTVFIAIMVKKSLKHIIKTEKPQTIKLGVGGLLANKAAILAPIRAGDARITAVCCHLTAHEPNFEERNAEIHQILESVGNDVDYLFFLGDLNYRITRTYEETLELCKNKEISTLLANDQLKNIQATDKTIGELIESKITFLPTYKFDKNSDIYDTSSKKRVPSYTDRILYRTGPKRLFYSDEKSISFETDAFKHFVGDQSFFTTDCNVSIKKNKENYPTDPHCVIYRSLKSRYSDHKPVHALYKVDIPTVDPERYNEMEEIIDVKYEELKKITKPVISVDPTTIVCTSQKAYTRITNKSLVWVDWSIKKAHGKIGLSPCAGVLMAGESCEIEIKFSKDLDIDEADFVIGLSNGQETTITFTTKVDETHESTVLTIPSADTIESHYKSLPVNEQHFINMPSPAKSIVSTPGDDMIPPPFFQVPAPDYNDEDAPSLLNAPHIGSPDETNDFIQHLENAVRQQQEIQQELALAENLFTAEEEEGNAAEEEQHHEEVVSTEEEQKQETVAAEEEQQKEENIATEAEQELTVTEEKEEQELEVAATEEEQKQKESVIAEEEEIELELAVPGNQEEDEYTDDGDEEIELELAVPEDLNKQREVVSTEEEEEEDQNEEEQPLELAAAEEEQQHEKEAKKEEQQNEEVETVEAEPCEEEAHENVATEEEGQQEPIVPEDNEVAVSEEEEKKDEHPEVEVIQEEQKTEEFSENAVEDPENEQQ